MSTTPPRLRRSTTPFRRLFHTYNLPTIAISLTILLASLFHIATAVTKSLSEADNSAHTSAPIATPLSAPEESAVESIAETYQSAESAHVPPSSTTKKSASTTTTAAQNTQNTQTAENAQSAKPAQTTETPACSYCITIAGRTIPIFDVSDTSINAGSRVARYRSKFFYGHNTSNVFAGLASLPIGAIFTITINGQSTTYQVAHKVTFEYDKAQAKNPEYRKDDPTYLTPATMKNIANAIHLNHSYSISLMTCAGTPKPGGDATHRLVLFANQL